MGREGSGFDFLEEKHGKTQGWYIDDPYIRELMKDAMFDEAVSEAELPA